jgi:membrane-associated phospholipid phosphatase
LREITLLLLCSVVINDLLLLLVTTAGRAPSPLADVRLERIDSSLHLSTAAVVRWITRFPALSGCLTVIYHLLTVVVAFALLAPALSGNFDASRRYVFSVLIAGTITAVLFAACPAAGPWVGHKYRPTAGQSHVEVYLRLVKSARSIPLDFSEGGIVSFPSFHVVLAVLSAVALWDFRTARWIVLAVSTAICISTVTTGWHYFIDVIGGLAVAAIADAIAARALQTDLVSYS